MPDACPHWSKESGYAQASLYAACPWCEIEKLRSELTAAQLERDEARRKIDYRNREAPHCPTCDCGSSGHP